MLALSLSALAGCSAAYKPPSDISEVRRAAADALAVFVDSWNRAAAGDPQAPAAYGTQYWPDAELVDPSGNIWEGQPTIVQMHVDLWNTAFKGSNVKGSVRKTRQLSPTLMIADFDMDLSLFREAPPGSAPANAVVKTHLKHVMEKRDVEGHCGAEHVRIGTTSSSLNESRVAISSDQLCWGNVKPVLTRCGITNV